MEQSLTIDNEPNGYSNPNTSGYLNDNMKSVKSLHLDPIYKDNERELSNVVKNQKMTNVSFVEHMFHGYPYKIEKIEDHSILGYKGSNIQKNTTESMSAHSSSNSNSDVKKNKKKKKKNVTSIIPFDRIMENQVLQNVMSKKDIQHLVKHKNMYEERESMLHVGTRNYPYQIFSNVDKENGNRKNTNSLNHSTYTQTLRTNLIANANQTSKNNKLMEVYDKEKNKKVIYYSVVNHYDPHKSKEEEEEKKKTEKTNNDLYNKNAYESDIYDYLLNQYEKNYKKLVSQISSTTSKMNSVETNETELSNKKLKKNGIKDFNKKIKDVKENDEEEEERNQMEKVCTLNDKTNKIEADPTEDNADKESYTTFMNHRRNSIESLNEKEKKFNSKLHNPSLYIEDSLDIFKDTGDIHTKKPKLLIRSSKNNSHEAILKINRDTKKILKKLKSKNTVIISNIGIKCGSSTFSNYIINNDQINNFTKDVHNTGECVCSYITTNHNRINYVYLDFDKISKKNQVEPHPNKFISLSFYLSNIIIIHIDEKNYLDMFYLLSDYYTIIKNIRENIRQRRKKWKEAKRKREQKQRNKKNHVPIFNNTHNKNEEISLELIEPSPTESNASKSNDMDLEENEDEEDDEEEGDEEEEEEEEETEESSFDVNKLSMPYFIFLLRDFNKGTTNDKSEEAAKTPQRNFASAEEHLNAILYNVYDMNLKKRISYVMKYLVKKNIMYLPCLYKNKSETIINYEYMYSLKNVKKELFIQSKGIDNMYRNNGVYIYKYLSMVVYTINNHIYYSSDHLKKKIENFENRMLQDVLTENLLVNIRKKMEKKLPLKIDYLLTLTNELKLEFILTYEKFAIGNESTKKKYKQQLSKSIDSIILKTYKENLAYSYYAFYNEINKRIEQLNIESKIENKKYQNFEEFVRELQSINEKGNDNFVYNEILNKKKEEIITTFVNKYYHTKNGTVKNFIESTNNISVKNETQNDSESDFEPLNNENEKTTKSKDDYFLNALKNRDYSNSNFETNSFNKSNGMNERKKRDENESDEYLKTKNVSRNDSLIEYVKENYKSNKKEKSMNKSFSLLNKNNTKRNSYFGDSDDTDKDPDVNHLGKKYMNKHKSEKYVYDIRKRMQKTESKLPKKYKSLDYPYRKSKIDIYKKLMNNVHSDSSQELSDKGDDTQPDYSIKWKSEKSKISKNLQSSETIETNSENVDIENYEHKYNHSLTDIKKKKKLKKRSCFRRKGRCSVM